MTNASNILEAKGYSKDEVDSILSWGGEGEESLDIQTRNEFGFEDEPVHLWASYEIGDGDEVALNEIAKEKGFDDYKELFYAATKHLNSLAESYPEKK